MFLYHLFNSIEQTLVIKINCVCRGGVSGLIVIDRGGGSSGRRQTAPSPGWACQAWAALKRVVPSAIETHVTVLAATCIGASAPVKSLTNFHV